MNHLGELAPPPWECWRWLNHPKLSSPARQATDMLPKRTHSQNSVLQATRASKRVRNAHNPKTQSLMFSIRSKIQPSNEFKHSSLQDSKISQNDQLAHVHTCTPAPLRICKLAHGACQSTAVPSHVFQHVSQGVTVCLSVPSVPLSVSVCHAWFPLFPTLCHYVFIMITISAIICATRFRQFGVCPQENPGHRPKNRYLAIAAAIAEQISPTTLDAQKKNMITMVPWFREWPKTTVTQQNNWDAAMSEAERCRVPASSFSTPPSQPSPFDALLACWFF